MTLGFSKAYTPASNEIANSTNYNTDIATLFNAFAGLEADPPTSSISHFAIDATGKLYLDGGSDTYIQETTANNLRLYIGGQLSLELDPNWIAIPTTQGLYFDGGVSANAAISDTSNGTGSTALYIGNQQITTSSDIRLKKNIEDTTIDSLKIINDLHVVDFDWNDKVEEGDSRKQRGRYTGLLAQEMIKTVPWTVNHQNGKDCELCNQGRECPDHQPWLVEYEYIVPVLVKAIQELNKKIKRLES